MIKYILGIQSYANHDTGACILKFGKNIKPEFIAISEERLIRKKYPYSFPIHSILYCMRHFKISDFKKIDLIVSDWIRIKKWIRSGPAYNYQKYDYIKEKLNFNKKKIIQINHHLAHAASTYYPSKFKSASILIVDGNGSDLETNSYYIAKKNKISLIDSYKFHGIGDAYAATTRQILNLGTGGEGKTMGLAPYGKYNKKIKIKVELKNIETNFQKFKLRMPNSDVLNQINPNFRPNLIKEDIKPANKKNITSKKYADWAYMIQSVTEKTMIHLANDLYKKTKQKNLCLAGGVALNSVANEKLFINSKFKDIFIFPACADAGIPFGLTIWAYYNKYNQNSKIRFDNAFTGIKYKKDSIKKLLLKYNIPFKEKNNFNTAQQISEGKIIANFNEASEYGPRALGNRSILADPRRKSIRDHINKYIKHREIFRPFAPAILEEKSSEYFDVNYSPFMLRVAKCKKKNKIPSALHVDNTARVQTVNKKQNKNFYDLINQFYKITGVPVLLNTSFNDAGEPLVETPVDALITSIKTNIDFLILQDFEIHIADLKKNTKINLLKKLNNNRNADIIKEEKFALKTLTKNYSEKQFIQRKKKENKIAVDHVLNRPFKLYKKFFKDFDINEKLLIIGSNDHTHCLNKLFKKDINKIKNVQYYELKENDIYPEKKKINLLQKNKTLLIKKDYRYLISSFQFSEEIKDKLINKSVKFFCPYDNSSRSIMDYAYIKKFKGKNKIFSKKLD